MAALRVPFAVGSSGFLSLSLFYVLWIFVATPANIDPVVEPIPIVFTRPYRPITIVEPPDERIPRKPPQLIPEPIRIGTGAGSVDNPTPYVQHTFVPGRIGGAIAGSDRDAIPLVRITPDYPPRAASAGIEGWVKVQFSITTVGSVRDPFVVEAEPPNVFDDAALKAIARWRYQPRVQGGVATERVGLQTIIRFDLEGD